MKRHLLSMSLLAVVLLVVAAPAHASAPFWDGFWGYWWDVLLKISSMPGP